MWTETDWVADKSEDATIRFGGKNEDRTKIWYLTIFNIWYIINDWYIQSAALALDQSILDVDQVENLIKFCPTKEEMELLKVPHQYIVFLLPWWSHFINLPSYFFCQNYTWWSCYINLPSYFFYSELHRRQGNSWEVWTGNGYTLVTTWIPLVCMLCKGKIEGMCMKDHIWRWMHSNCS